MGERGWTPDDRRCQYSFANSTLATPRSMSPAQVYRMAGESLDPQAAAHEYEQHLRRASNTSPSSRPTLDLVLLGLGEDGHTASLFPGSPALRDNQCLITVTQSPKDPPTRLTMPLGVINQASVILFLV